MPEGLYDHCPCIVRFEEFIIQRAKAFKYFNMWKLDDKFESVIEGVWRQEMRGNLMYKIVSKLKDLKKEFRKMDGENFSLIEKRCYLMQLVLHQCQEELWGDPKNQNLLCVREKLYL